MPKMDLIFVSSGRHPETEALIRKATNSRFAHAAIGLEVEGVYFISEAVRPAVRFSEGNQFKDATELQTITVEITEEQRNRLALKAIRNAGKPYSIKACAIGGTHNVLGDMAAEVLDQVLSDEGDFDCSGHMVDMVREIFPAFMDGEDQSRIVPEAARVAAMEFFKET